MMLLQYPAVCPYLGWIEAYGDIRPLFPWMMAGAGFYVVMYAARRIEYWLGHERRAGDDRRVP